MPLALETTALSVKERLDSGEALTFLDVREPFEYQLSHLENSHLVPMNTVPASLQQIELLAGESVLIVICHHGMRSLSVVNWLRGQGVDQCQSMSGGIDAWSTNVDPAIPRY